MGSRFSFLRDLERAATPAPWATHLVDDTTVVANDGATIAETFSEGGRDADVDFFSPVERHEADACFIAAMRNAMPGLIDELDRIERDLASACAENDKLRAAIIGVCTPIIEYANAERDAGRADRAWALYDASNRVSEHLRRAMPRKEPAK